MILLTRKREELEKYGGEWIWAAPLKRKFLVVKTKHCYIKKNPEYKTREKER